jgi:hypothetical protein
VAKKKLIMRAVTDMRRFHATLDFSELWQDFYLSLRPSGTPRYKSIRGFVNSKAGWGEKQKDFMYWLLGPEEPVDTAMSQQYKWCSPQDWEEKRSTGGWYSEQSLRDYGKSVRDKIDALESLRAAGNNVTINSLVRVEYMMQQLDKEFGGRFLVETLSAKANAERASLYVRLQKQLLGMLDQAQDIYAKSHGINFHDMSGFESLLTAQMLTRRVEAKEDNGRKVMEKLIDMTLEKSLKYDTPMPEGVKETALAVLAKARKVN